MNLNHVHFGTKDLATFVDFYERYFGFKKKFQSGTTTFLANASGFLIAVDPVDNLPAFPEWYHLGFCLDKEAEVLRMYEKLKAGKANIVRDLVTQEDAFASFFLKDPDGNKLEVSWHNE